MTDAVVPRVGAMNTDTHPRPAPPEAPYAAIVAATPARDVDLEIRGSRAHVRVYGDPAAPRRMVFLHGLRGDHHGLEPIVAHLLAERSDLQVWVPDLPGFGASAPLGHGVHDVAGYAAWTTELLTAVAPGGDVVLAGHSFGSIVAAATAADRVVRALVLVNPIATAALDGPRRAMSAVTVGVHRLAAALPERAGTGLLRHPLFTRVASLAMVTSDDRDLRRWIHAEHDRYFSGFADRRTLLEAFHASVGTDVSAYAGRITAPTLLVASENDDVAPLPSQRVLAAALADARLAVVPRTGHLAHYEAPAVVARETAGFLAALEAARDEAARDEDEQ
ncbi:Pimeloyl-ACP methyl ester carboxylesterase [Promicromonospora thailandica]|uniref:Pimeloyl-ACP methyl ester carboxylesterase n=2 Tax=Promicromonospora thailandica TaxID=765201 RepID=A0A9X2G303_9MICO|nr:Pimeloyl-ACP methyl ester carboxylesterase [Promicromonospora thailandica]BFF20609.1 alpha/beta hydrolase [Promicromonospora thailandica]